MSVVVDFLKSFAGICEARPLSPDHWQLQGNRATVRIKDVPELHRPGGAVYLAGNGLDISVLIVRGDDGNYHCFSNRCTHMGRRLDPVKGKCELRCCSVTHSTFDSEGNNLSGPAKTPVQTYRSDVENAELVVMI